MLARKELDQAGLDLLEAANIKEQRGHSQGALYSYDKKDLCIYAAICETVGIDTVFAVSNGHLRVYKAEQKFSDYTNHSVCEFNNTHTKDECVTALREAAYS